MADITYCSANEQTCPLTNTCRRAEWRKSPSVNRLMRQLSFADFSEELVYHREVDEDNSQLVTCPFYMGEQRAP